MKLQIPEPCSQQWEQMAFLNDTSRFCAECSRKIIDFSKMSDNQILKQLWTNPDKICGKFSPSQLNRSIDNSEFHFPSLKALLLAGTLTTFSNEFHSQVSETKIEQQQIKLDTSFQIICGNVRDTSKTNRFYDLVVELPYYKLFCQIDSSGNFQFSVPAHDLPDSIKLIVRKGNALQTFKGLNPTEFINLEVCLIPIVIDANFIQETQLIGFVVVKPKWYQFGFKFRRLWNRLIR